MTLNDLLSFLQYNSVSMPLSLVHLSSALLLVIMIDDDAVERSCQASHAITGTKWQ